MLVMIEARLSRGWSRDSIMREIRGGGFGTTPGYGLTKEGEALLSVSQVIQRENWTEEADEWLDAVFDGIELAQRVGQMEARR